MKITKQALLDRGFKHHKTKYDSFLLSEYSYYIKGGKIEIYGVNLNIVEIVTDAINVVEGPNCRTLKQLDKLIDLFKEKLYIATS